ncbi:acyltransferase [Sulfitobacter sp. 1A13496]|uniref:acyltransferase n=1 Tax=Sulfitobacter sp. 1A13496 TaxID=3368596 RepID=UPI0037459428
MKQCLLRLEYNLLRMAPIRLAVGTMITFGFRLCWLWGRVRFGALVKQRGISCVCAPDVDLKYPQNIHLGDRVIIGSNVSLGAHSPITMGDDVRISRDVIIETAGLNYSTGRPPYKHISKPVTIEKGVWIGARAIVLGGVTLGENAVIAAGSVVSRSVPPGTTVAGIPARSIRSKKPKE